jgi:hypothetical protein
MAPDGYYSFERLEGGHDGLVRVSSDGTFFECVHDGEWVTRWEILRYFVNPGTSFLEPVDDATARSLADRYGVTI